MQHEKEKLKAINEFIPVAVALSLSIWLDDVRCDATAIKLINSLLFYWAIPKSKCENKNVWSLEAK